MTDEEKAAFVRWVERQVVARGRRISPFTRWQGAVVASALREDEEYGRLLDRWVRAYAVAALGVMPPVDAFAKDREVEAHRAAWARREEVIAEVLRPWALREGVRGALYGDGAEVAVRAAAVRAAERSRADGGVPRMVRFGSGVWLRYEPESALHDVAFGAASGGFRVSVEVAGFGTMGAFRLGRQMSSGLELAAEVALHDARVVARALPDAQ